MIGYQPGVVGGIARLHAHYYAKEAGFDQDFEIQVATELAEFVPRLKFRCNQLWSRWEKENVTASVAIDGETLGRGKGLLRWFIVHPSLHGMGIGSSLLNKALRFCDEHNMTQVELWSFAGFDAARELYEDNGFELAEERPGANLGKDALEQRFVRLAPVDA